MNRALAIPFTVLVLGCGTSSTDTPGRTPTEASSPSAPMLGQVLTLRHGASAEITGESLTLVFRSLGIDSRCPIDVDCVWEGNAEVHIDVMKAGQPGKQLALNTTAAPRRASYLGYEIELRSLAPEQRSDAQIAQRDYVVQLVVTRQ